MPFKAVTFDCYGTLIDWDTGVGAFFEAWSSAHGLALERGALLGALAEAQRRHQASTPFKPYRAVLRDAFLDVARDLGVTRAQSEAERFAASVGSWPPFADTLPTLRQLKAHHVLGIVSNVDEASFAETRGWFEGLIDEAVTADAVRAYKPDPAHFRAMFARLDARGIARDHVVHVAQSRFHDIAPARALGVRCVWVERRAGRPGRGLTIPSEAEPDFRAAGLSEVAKLLARLRPG